MSFLRVYFFINNCLFIFNTSKWGGGIYLENCADVQIEKNIFIGNYAVRDGGAISISNSNNICILKNHFVLNYAKRFYNNIDVYNSNCCIMK